MASAPGRMTVSICGALIMCNHTTSYPRWALPAVSFSNIPETLACCQHMRKLRVRDSIRADMNSKPRQSDFDTLQHPSPLHLPPWVEPHGCSQLGFMAVCAHVCTGLCELDCDSVLTSKHCKKNPSKHHFTAFANFRV